MAEERAALPPDTGEWEKLQRIAPAERRVAVVLDGNAPPTLAAACALLAALGDAGYRVESVPPDAASLARGLAQAEAEAFSRADYALFFAAQPRAAQEAMTARWGAPEADTAFRAGRLDCGALLVPVLRLGGVAVALQPPSQPGAPPRHGALAAEAWAEDAFRAHAVSHVAADGRIAWRQGETLRRPP